jgi:hypothetical protein
LLEAREIVIDLFERGADLATRGLAGERSGQQILFDRQMGKAVTSLHHLADATADELVRRQLVDPLAFEFDRSLGDVAALGREQIRYRLERRRFARAVRAQQGDDAPFRHLQRDAAQNEYDVVVDDLDVVDRERDRRRRRDLRRHRSHLDHRTITFPWCNRAA